MGRSFILRSPTIVKCLFMWSFMLFVYKNKSQSVDWRVCASCWRRTHTEMEFVTACGYLLFYNVSVKPIFIINRQKYRYLWNLKIRVATVSVTKQNFWSEFKTQTCKNRLRQQYHIDTRQLATLRTSYIKLKI